MKEKIRNVYELVLGVLFIVSVIAGYYKDFSYMSEYCFISGITVGAIFLYSFFYTTYRKRKLPIWIYFDCMISIMIIFIATIAIGLNLEGAFWFIHIIDPILLFLYWCVFCNHRNIHNLKLIATDTIFPICYFIFAFVLWKTIGKCPFPASLIFVGNSLGVILLYVVGIVALFLAVGYTFHFLNILAYKKIIKIVE
jgi:hypothetical protein